MSFRHRKLFVDSLATLLTVLLLVLFVGGLLAGIKAIFAYLLGYE